MYVAVPKIVVQGYRRWPHKGYLGNGRNGKSTFYELVHLCMGEFFALLPKDLVIHNKNGSSAGAANPHLFAIRNARLAVFDEVEEGERVNSRSIKRMANGDQ